MLLAELRSDSYSRFQGVVGLVGFDSSLVVVVVVAVVQIHRRYDLVKSLRFLVFCFFRHGGQRFPIINGLNLKNGTIAKHTDDLP